MMYHRLCAFEATQNNLVEASGSVLFIYFVDETLEFTRCRFSIC